jgi:hypothetical protein
MQAILALEGRFNAIGIAIHRPVDWFKAHQNIGENDPPGIRLASILPLFLLSS